MILTYMDEMPKIFPILAEWFACLYYIFWNKKRISTKYVILASVAALFALSGLHWFLEYHHIAFWIPSMAIIVVVMAGMTYLCCDINIFTAGYFCVGGLILSEFMSSFAWQMCYFFYIRKGIKSALLEVSTEIAIYICLLFLLYHLDKIRQRKGLKYREFEATKREFKLVLIIGVITFTMGNLNFVIWVSPFMGSTPLDLHNIRTWITLCGYAILCAYHEQIVRLRIMKEVYLIRSLLDKQYEQYKKFQESMEYMNRQHHDFKHILTLLSAGNDTDRKTEYLHEIEEKINNYGVQMNTGNSVLDTVLTSKMLICQKCDITITCVANGELLNRMHVFDICNIFGNALDNAIECVLQVAETEKRLIHVLVSSHNHFAIIRIENYFEGTLEIKDGLPYTTKPDKEKHGYGLKSIQHTARKNKGEMTITCVDNWYVLNIMIPNE